MIKLIREYSKDLHVLYVEDDQDLSKSTREVLENFFKSVDVAYDGQEGEAKYKDYLDENAHPYDLVITDINMPQMNGIELSRMILKQTPHQAIIIISAHDETGYLSEAIDMGISAFVTKPIKQKGLYQALYKTSMAIFDHKFVEGHIDRLEELNLRLENQNNELAVKNAQLEKSLRLLNTISHKNELLHPTKQTYPTTTAVSDSTVFRLKEQLSHFIEEDLAELKDLLTEIDLVVIDIINNIDAIAIDSRSLLASLFKKYALSLSMYTFFDELSLAMSSFSHTLENHPLPLDTQRIQNIFLLLETFVFDLGRWHTDLSSCDENKLNLFDASNIGNMQLITNMWLANDMDEATDKDLDAIFEF
ncbi:MAG: response regulator [Sulfurimonas sp.]|jgi:CheY-like chemotaxis protein